MRDNRRKIFQPMHISGLSGGADHKNTWMKSNDALKTYIEDLTFKQQWPLRICGPVTWLQSSQFELIKILSNSISTLKCSFSRSLFFWCNYRNDWNRKIALQVHGQFFFYFPELQDLLQRNKWQFPNYADDLVGAMAALFRLQDTYNISTADMVNNNMQGKQKQRAFTAYARK